MEREVVTSWAQSELMEDGVDLVGKCELPQVRYMGTDGMKCSPSRNMAPWLLTLLQ